LSANTIIQAQEIIDAAKSGDLSKVKELVEKNPQLVNTKDITGRTPLHWAARGVHLELLKYLVEKGADVNARDTFRIIPLHSVVSRNNLNAAEYLLDHGSDINAQDNNEKSSSLHFASYRGFKDMAKLLIDRGALLNLLNKYNRTCLFEAIRGYGTVFQQARDKSEWIEIVKALIAKGADLDIPDGDNLSPLILAVNDGSNELVKLLLDAGAAVSDEGEGGISLLHQAAQSGMGELTEILLSKGADIKSLNSNGGSLLQSAAKGGLTNIVERLAREDLDVSKKDRYGIYPIHSAAINGHGEIIKLLIGKGADKNVRTPQGKTAFNIAQEKKYIDVADMLITLGADQSPAKFPVLKGGYLGQKRPGNRPEMFAPGIVSTESTEHGAPVFSPNGNEIYWFSWPGPITQTMHITKGRWTSPVIVDLGTNPTMSPDGKRIFFGRRESGSRGIGYCERTDGAWCEQKWFDTLINNANSGWEIWLAKSGTVYFSTRMAGGNGGTDICKSSLVNGKYENIENLGPEVNSESDEWGDSGGYVSPDESYLIFSSDRPGGYGGSDLYISFRRKDGTWTKAVNMGNEINNNELQMWPCVSPDGKYLFYISQINGAIDCYWISAKIIEELKPKGV